jgi:arginine exporter protein ArgO
MANPLTIIVFVGFAGLLTSDTNGNIFLHALVIFIASLLVQMLIAITGSKLARFFSKPTTLLYFNLASSLGIMLLGISKLL